MRKNLLASVAAQETVPNANPTTHEYTRHGASRSMLISLEEMADNAKKMLAGEAIMEIDPALIDPSFAQDRMAAFEPEGADAGFVAAIKEQGQLVPILLRKHPDKDGRYQPAYGRRRIAAGRHLGIKVRAIVKDLSDEQLVVAQGQENESRNALTFIEKCRFAATLESQKFSRKVIENALNLDHTHVSRMLQVVEAVPSDLIDWIGAAPEIGRPRWLALAVALKEQKSKNRAKLAVSKRNVSGDTNLSSTERFALVAAAAAEKAGPAKPLPWTLPGLKKAYGKLSVSRRSITLTIDRSANPKLAELVLEKLEALRRAIESADITSTPNQEH